MPVNTSAESHRTEFPRAEKPRNASEIKKTYHRPLNTFSFLALLRLSINPCKNSDAPGCDSDGFLGQGGIRQGKYNQLAPGIVSSGPYSL